MKYNSANQADWWCADSTQNQPFIKQIMREQNAIYGGEMITHYHLRNFIYSDSGMIPWLPITELMCKTGKMLAELVDERMAAPTPAVVESITMSKIFQEPLSVLASFFFIKPKINHTDHIDGVSACVKRIYFLVGDGTWKIRNLS